MNRKTNLGSAVVASVVVLFAGQVAAEDASTTLARAGQADAAPLQTEPRLSATLVGKLEAGAAGRLAVRWDGPDGSLLDAWVDLDGDGSPGPHELVAEGRPLASGIEVVSFDLAPGAQVVPEPRVWVRTRDGVRCEAWATVGLGAANHSREDCAWQQGFGFTDLDGSVKAMAVFDDGSGPALFVGGWFETADNLTVNHIARWDGDEWSPLSGLSSGPSSTGLENLVFALAVHDDGTGPALYVGGTFDTAGDATVNRIARWDGSEWSALSGPSGTGVNYGGVYALAVYDDGSGPALYAGGAFSTAGGVSVNNIARWDGSSWSALSGPAGTGLDGYVHALASFDDGTGPALYAGGPFESAGGLTVNNIARWDGNTWSALYGPAGPGVTGEQDTSVRALSVFDDGAGPALFVGGSFDDAGGLTVNNIARWDGGAWSALSGPSDTGTAGGGYGRGVYSLTAFDDGDGVALYAGGRFNTAGGVTVNHIARWDGSEWSALSGPADTGMSSPSNLTLVDALAVFDDGSGGALHAGGYFTSVSGVGVSNIARWDGAAWSAVSTPSGSGLNESVSALAVFDDGDGEALYAGGRFVSAGNVTVSHIARWDGTEWSTVGTGVTGGSWPGVWSFAVYDDGSGPALYAGGNFETAGGVTVNHIARWDGTEWSALSGPAGTGVTGLWGGGVLSLAVFDDGSGPALYAGGGFGFAGGVQVRGIARWDGTTWSGLAGGMGVPVGGPYVNSLAVFDDGSGPALYAGGYLWWAGGVTVNNIARWDGTAWSGLSGPTGTGLDGYVYAIADFNDGTGSALFAGGSFTTAGGVTANYIARWDGTEWSGVSGPAGTGLDGYVHALADFNDGTGSALFAGGGFYLADDVIVAYVARWDGTAWSGLGPGVDRRVSALASFDAGLGPTLYAGGDFTTAGGLPSSRIAAWRCLPDPFFADGFEAGSTEAWSHTVP